MEIDPQSSGETGLEPRPELTWVLSDDFVTSEEAVRRVFAPTSVQPEGVEFTNASGERQTVVVLPPES